VYYSTQQDEILFFNEQIYLKSGIFFEEGVFVSKNMVSPLHFLTTGLFLLTLRLMGQASQNNSLDVQ
jgi:hypothetical protein